MKPAVGYIRFSREDQGKGSTIERQSENILAYCQQHGLDLVETLTDEGFSASKGEHISHPKAKFGAFLARVDNGEYRGHALVVEQLDRLSRLGIDASSEIIRRLLKGGVIPHISQENRPIPSLDDLTTVVLNAIQAFGAAEYSKKLSERIGAAWAAKKAKARATHEAITAHVPNWLERDGDENRALPDRVATVQKIFRLAEAGYGVKRIADRLSEDGDQPFSRPGNKKQGKSWTLPYIQSILANRAVLGEYTPRGCEPIFDYFPRIIEQTQFDAVRAAIKSRDRVSAETRRYCGGKGDGSRNLFSRMVFDGETGRAMNFHDKGGDNAAFLVSAYEAGKKAKRIQYDLIELGVLQFLGDVDWRAVASEGDPKELEGLKQRLNEIATEIDRLNRVVARDSKLLDDADTDYATAKFIQKGLAEKDTRLTQLTEARDKTNAELNAERAKIGVIQDPAELARLILSDRGAVDVRLRLHQELKRRISRIELDFRSKPFITEFLGKPEFRTLRKETQSALREHQDFVKRMREVNCVIRFVNGVERRFQLQTGFPHGMYRMVVVEPGKGYRATWLKPKRTSAGKPPQAPPKAASVRT